MGKSRKPEVIADAAFAILTRNSKSFTGNICLDDEVLHSEGITDLDKYSYDKGKYCYPEICSTKNIITKLPFSVLGGKS